jgi:hypothetical protein
MEGLKEELSKVGELLEYYKDSEAEIISNVGNYSLGRKLGDGAFSEVKLGTDKGGSAVLEKGILKLKVSRWP